MSNLTRRAAMRGLAAITGLSTIAASAEAAPDPAIVTVAGCAIDLDRSQIRPGRLAAVVRSNGAIEIRRVAGLIDRRGPMAARADRDAIVLIEEDCTADEVATVVACCIGAVVEG